MNLKTQQITLTFLINDSNAHSPTNAFWDCEQPGLPLLAVRFPPRAREPASVIHSYPGESAGSLFTAPINHLWNKAEPDEWL